MSNTSRNNWTGWLVGLLVVLNLLTLATLWMTRGRGGEPLRGKHKHNVSHFFEEKLDLSEKQTLAFKELWDEHFEEVRTNRDEIRMLREKRMAILTQEIPDTVELANLTQEIAAKYASVEEMLSDHYFKLKGVLDEPQQKVLGEVFHDIIKKMNPRPKGKKR